MAHELLQMLEKIQETEVVNIKTLEDVIDGLLAIHPNPDLELPRGWRNYTDIQKIGWLITTLPHQHRTVLKNVLHKLLQANGYQRTSFAQKAKHLSGL